MKDLYFPTSVKPARAKGLAEVAELARGFAAAARSEGTRKAYTAQWRGFLVWCQHNGYCALPAEPKTVAMFLAHRASEGLAVATIGLALTTICQAHRIAEYEPPRTAPIVRQIWKGIKRELGVAQKRAKPVTVSVLRSMIDALPENLRGERDRALLCLGFAGAFRRSELVALNVPDLSFTDDGLIIKIRRSKTDQEAEGTTVGIPFGGYPATCPVRSVKTWLNKAGIDEGSVFRAIDSGGQIRSTLSDRAVARIIKRAAKAAGFDPVDFSGHSLRSGLATQAAKSGKSDRSIMRQGRWRSRTMVDRYVREATLFNDNAATGIGL